MYKVSENDSACALRKLVGMAQVMMVVLATNPDQAKCLAYVIKGRLKDLDLKDEELNPELQLVVGQIEAIEGWC